jgi:hypothetical protein
VPALWRRLKPYALLTILALPALWPTALAGIPRTNDNLDHFFRAVELDQLVRAGIFFPRWAPHLVLNFGYPVFDFFPYEAHYLVEALHLVGLNFLTAYNLAGALALLASGWFAFRLGREHFGLAGGLVAGVAYLYSPYLLYDNYVRGSLPESLALALLPLALLYLRRAVRGDRPAAACASLALGAAILAHHGVMLQAIPFVGGYAVWEMVSGNWRLESRDWRLKIGNWKLLITNYQLLLLPFILALALSSFFWLPALAEARYIQTERGTGNGAMNYANNFLGLDQLLALPRLPVDPDLLNPPVVHSLPVAALVLAGLAVARWAWPRTRPQGAAEQGWSLSYLVAASLAGTLLIHPIAKPLWEAVPLLQVTLFPWRLLGAISLLVALAAGALFVEGGREMQGGRTPQKDGGQVAVDEGRINQHFVFRRSSPAPFFARGFVILAIVLVFLIGAGLPFATPPRETVTANPSLADLAAFEIPPDYIGTTTVGEYLPAWVRQLPDLAADREHLARGENVARYQAPGAGVQPGPELPVGAMFTVQAQQAVRFVYRTFYFPGWRAILDGQPAPISITAPEGLMAVTVPAGTHSLAFDFGSTPPRTLGDLASIIGLVAVAGWLLWPSDLTLRPRSFSRKSTDTFGGKGVPDELGAVLDAGLFGVAILLAAARPLLYDAGLTPLLRRGLAAQPPAVASQPLDLSFAGEVHLLGADLPARPVAADDPLIVTLYWQAEHKLGVDYGFAVRLVDDAGHGWTVPGFSRPADWRFSPGTDFWPTGQYILDPYVLTWLAGTPPGRYIAAVTVFARYNQQSIGTQPVGVVTVGSPARKQACPDSLGAAPTPGVTLRQGAIEPASASPGDEVTVSLCWVANSALTTDLTGQLRLADTNGMVLAVRSFTLGGSYPASRWAAGDVLRDQVTVLLPARLATGQYTWSASVAEGSPVPLGVESITAPARIFESPPVETRLDANLGPITLWGVSGPPPGLAPGADLKLVLAWLANQTPNQGYHVFVHLQSADGTIVAQSDGVPAGWTRRTTGWLPGEYVLDARTLKVPPDLARGEYSLFAGLYRPDTGERLTTTAFPDGQVPLGKVAIGK